MRMLFRPLPVVLILLMVFLGHKVQVLWGSVSHYQAIEGEVEAADAAAGEKGKSEGDNANSKSDANSAKEASPETVSASGNAPGSTKSTPEQPDDGKTKTPRVTTPFDLLNLSTTEVALLQELNKKNQDVDSKSKQLQEQERQLKLAQEQLLKQINQLKEMKEALQKDLKAYDEKSEQRIKNLVKIYENMKPKEAARIFEALEIDTVLAIVENMKEAKTSPILATMQTEKAKEITAKLLSKKQQSPSM